jgi:hypothetical protein
MSWMSRLWRAEDTTMPSFAGVAYHYGISVYRTAEDTRDIGCGLLALGTDTHRVRFGRRSGIADVDVSGPGGQSSTRPESQCDVVASGGIVFEGAESACCIGVSGDVAVERIDSVGSVVASRGVAVESADSAGGAEVTGALFSAIAKDYEGLCASIPCRSRDASSL